MADTTAQVSHASAAAAPMNAVEPMPAQKSTTTPESAAAQQNTDNVPVETSGGASDVADGESEFGDDFFRDWFGYEPPDIFSGLLGDDAIDGVETVVQRSAEAENVGHRASREQQQQHEAARTQDTQEQAEVAAPEPRASEPRTVTPEPGLSTTERPAEPTAAAAAAAAAAATATAKPVLNEAHARRDRLLGRGLMGMFRRRHGKQGISSMLSSCLTFKGTKTPVTRVKCTACLDSFPPKKTAKTPCHSYCRPCFARLVETALVTEAQWPPRCCSNEVPAAAITGRRAGGLPRSLRARYLAKVAEYRVPIDKRLYCPHPDCGVFIRQQQLQQPPPPPPQQHSSAFSFLLQHWKVLTGDGGTTKCPRGHGICIPCRQPRHPLDGRRCRRDPDRRLADALADEQGWRRCFKCDVLVEHTDACHHMTCRCGAQFCFVCGLKWRSCDCTAEMLRLVKDAAEVRRALARENAAAAELAAAPAGR